MPAVPKPPIITVEPSFTSASAASMDGAILLIIQKLQIKDGLNCHL
jgi:hypothetical protein